jgi:DNA-binding NarL/FixJ family response regulator
LIYVVIVDDHKIVVSGLKSVLELDDRIRVSGTATDVATGRRLCEELKPDVVILDVRMPDSMGLAEIPGFKQANPQMKVLILTGYGDVAQDKALAMGADALLTKELASDVIVETIYKWYPEKTRNGPLQSLSDREREVGRLAAVGLTNPEISAKLFISVNTVKTHLARVLDKFQVRDRTELARRWPEPL